MSDIGGRLRVKYKIVDAPTDQQAADWANLTEIFKREGLSSEDAGLQAARQLFEIDENLLLKAEADTIESLLERAKQK